MADQTALPSDIPSIHLGEDGETTIDPDTMVPMEARSHTESDVAAIFDAMYEMFFQDWLFTGRREGTLVTITVTGEDPTRAIAGTTVETSVYTYGIVLSFLSLEERENLGLQPDVQRVRFFLDNQYPTHVAPVASDKMRIDGDLYAINSVRAHPESGEVVLYVQKGGV